MILDEPTAMLDPKGRQEVINTVLRLNKEQGMTVVLITHFMEEAVLADRVVIMDGGSVISQGTPREIFSKPGFLREHGLDVPQSTELCLELGIEDCVLTVDECVEKLSLMMGGAV